MAIFERLEADVIEREFTHYGWFARLVPVYVDMRTPDNPTLAVRNWLPEWLLDAATAMWDFAEDCATWMDPDYESRGFPIKLTGRIVPAARA